MKDSPASRQKKIDIIPEMVDEDDESQIENS